MQKINHLSLDQTKVCEKFYDKLFLFIMSECYFNFPLINSLQLKLIEFYAKYTIRFTEKYKQGKVVVTEKPTRCLIKWKCVVLKTFTKH